MEKSWCEVCQYGVKAETLEELMQIWDKHTSTPQHVSNVIKYLMIDTGAKTLDEIPEKLDAYIANYEKRH